MRKHTPGPWKVGMKPGPIVYGPDGEEIAGMTVAMLPREEHFANARLIAAAPALAEALALVEGMLDNFPGFESCAYPLTDSPSANIGEIVRAALRAAGVIE